VPAGEPATADVTKPFRERGFVADGDPGAHEAETCVAARAIPNIVAAVNASAKECNVAPLHDTGG